MAGKIDIRELVFDPPGPGSWQIDDTHVTRPWPRFQAEIHPEQIVRGMRETCRRYGLLLELEWRMVNGFAYLTLVPVADTLVAERLAAAEAAFEGKLWRRDLERWQRVAKPAAIRAHLELQAIDPASLDDDALSQHLDRCRTHLKRMIYQHHWFNGAWILPLGDFLAHASDWTGRRVVELAGALRGSTPISTGGSDELEQLVEALRADAGAYRTLESDGAEPIRVLERLRARPGRTGDCVARFLEMNGYRLLDGHNVREPYVLEQPATLIETLTARLAHGGDDGHAGRAPELATAIRDDVPDSERSRYDALLEEARLTNPVRDERGLYGEVWAAGITRRVILEMGARLAAGGAIERPEHLVEAGYDELRALISGSGGPSPAELAARAEYGAAYRSADAPQSLGPAPEPPPPIDGLPPAAARAMRALEIALTQVFQPSQSPSEEGLVRGLGASPGIYEGTARVVAGPDEYGRIERGDVLVAQSTQEALNILLPLVGAIVTDAGGYLSHAAIVAREFGIPAVVGSLDATRVIADGARVRVDGTAGEVTLIAPV